MGVGFPSHRRFYGPRPIICRRREGAVPAEQECVVRGGRLTTNAQQMEPPGGCHVVFGSWGCGLSFEPLARSRGRRGQSAACARTVELLVQR